MYARVSELTGPVDRLDEGVAQYRGQVLAAMRAQEGYVRAYLLLDREGGKTLSITVWDSAEAMAASDEAANTVRSQVASTLGASAAVSRYEIAVVDPTS